MEEINEDILKKVYKPRPNEPRKHNFGLLTVIGGSEFYSGSPALSSMAAFKSGVDMVRIIAPKRAADIAASFSPTLAAYPLEGGWLLKKHITTLVSMTEAAKVVSKGKSAVIIGGGMGRIKETQEAIVEYLSQTSTSVVVDGDAIYAIANSPEIILNKPFLITPSRYEFFLLTKKDLYNLSEEEKIKIVQEEALRLGVTILLKGKIDIISNGKEVAVNRLYCPYLTKGGTGDTLAGICGALIARGIDPFLAAQAGAFINIRAGQLAAQNDGEGLLPTELISAISGVINSLGTMEE
jgi:NAD(P)H-hydrate epimerase